MKHVFRWLVAAMLAVTLAALPSIFDWLDGTQSSLGSVIPPRGK